MANTKEIDRMNELIKILNEAAYAYYNEDREIMSNYEYDMLCDELSSLENETGVILPDSPNSRAGYEAVSELKKVPLEFPALSLDKLKDRDQLCDWLGEKVGCLSWKMDGLTVVATYQDGALVSLVTRGGGYVGEDVTHNAKYIKGLPQKIPYADKLVVRGESIMKYKEFERINSEISDVKAKYKNARNLASATTRRLNSEEVAKKELWFTAFELVYADKNLSNSFSDRLVWLKDLGFNTVYHVSVTKDTLLAQIAEFEKEITNNEFPSDGLVLVYDDVKYGDSLGATGHHKRNGMAFKWADDTVETVITDVEWSASRTGLLNPVAIFEPVELEGTTVSRASVHNVSIVKSMHISVGSKAVVFKANMIIPQIAKVINPVGEVLIPDKCPCCDGKTEIVTNDDVETLYCTNPDCPAKHVGRFAHFVSKSGMNIIGFSEATIRRFVDLGYIRNFSDIYHLDKYKDAIIKMDGFGEKSYANLISSIEKSRQVKFSSFLSAIGIPMIGKDIAKVIAKALSPNALENFVEKLRLGEDFTNIDGVGEIINKNIYEWKANRKNGDEFADIVDELSFLPEDIPSASSSSGISGKTFVITGSVFHFKNRDEAKDYIEKNGGKVAGSVSAKTDYLVNNDSTSTSSKNKKAQQLNIPIITEEELLNL